MLKKTGILLVAVWALVLLAVRVPRSAADGPGPITALIRVDSAQAWQSSRIAIEADDYVVIEYLSGEWRSNPADPWHGPDGGVSLVCRGTGCVEPLPGFPKGGLVGRIGAGEVFAVGHSLAFIATERGILELRMNDVGLYDNQGALTVRVTLVAVRQASEVRMTVDASGVWQKSRVMVTAGDLIEIEYLSGEWRSNPADPWYGPDGGTSYACQGTGCIEPLPGFPKGGLVGRIGAGEVFAVGDHRLFTAPHSGVLELRMNDAGTYDNAGHVTIRITRHLSSRG